MQPQPLETADKLTRLVVGEARHAILGVEVAPPEVSAPAAVTLRWTGQGWAEDRVSRSPGNRPRATPQRRWLWLVSALGLGAINLGGWWYFGQTAPSRENKPPATAAPPLAGTPTAATQLPTPGTQPGAAPVPPSVLQQGQSETPLPSTSPATPLNAVIREPVQPTPAKLAQTATGKEATPLTDVRTQPKVKPEAEKGPRAVLFDAEQEAATRRPPAKEAPAATSMSAQMPRLMAFTPDGTGAIFRDGQGKTTIYRINDKLPDGAVITAVDRQAGKVTAGSREVRLNE